MTRKRIKTGARQRDVAAAAGVSTATVSAVVNGRAAQYGICRATQERVKGAIRQMGYSPSLAALDMVAGRNTLVGLAITAEYPGADRLIAALEPALAQAGLRLLVACLPADPAAAVTRITDLARYGIGGLAIYPARVLPLPGIGCPVVMVGKAEVGLPAECSPSAVHQLGQTTARWLQLASQGSPPGELLLEPSPATSPTNPPPAAVTPKPLPTVAPPVSLATSPTVSTPTRNPVEVPAVSLPNPPTVSLSNPPAVSLSNPPAVSLSNPVTIPPGAAFPAASVPEPPEDQAVPEVVPATPVEEETVPIPAAATPVADIAPITPEPLVTSPEATGPESSPESAIQPSESIQIPVTVVIDPAGQATVDPLPEATIEEEPSPNNVAIQQPPAVFSEPVSPTPVSEVSWPSPDPPLPEPTPVAVQTPELPPEPILTSEPTPEPVTTPVQSPAPIPTPEPMPGPEPTPVLPSEPEPTPVAVQTPELPPEPILTPEPTPEPVTTPVQSPAPMPTPEPMSGPEPTPVLPPEPEPTPVLICPSHRRQLSRRH